MKIISASLSLPGARSTPSPDFAVAVDGERIVQTGSHAGLARAFPEASVERFDQALLCPGFTNSHDHGRGLGTASLGIEDDVLEGWLFSLWAQPEITAYAAAAYDGLRLLRGGVTSTAHSHNPRAWRAQADEGGETVRGYGDAGIRVAFHPVMVDQNRLIYASSPQEEADFIAALPADLQEAARASVEPVLTHDDYFAQCDALYAAHHDPQLHRVHIQASPAGGQWCSDRLIMRSVDWARARLTRVQMHMLETHRQRDYAFRKWNKSFVRHLDDIGALGPWLTLAHMVWAEPDEFALLAERGVSIAHNPSSNLRLRSGIAPLSDMLQAGVNVGVGLDGHAVDDDQDYLRELRLAWTLSNMRTHQPGARDSTLAAAEVIYAGTTGGVAATFGPEAPLGQLAAGYLADLVIIDLGFAPPDIIQRPERAAAGLLHLAARAHVRHVMCGGEWVVRDGASTRLDEAALLAEIRAGVRRQQANSASSSRAGLQAQLATHVLRHSRGSRPEKPPH